MKKNVFSALVSAVLVLGLTSGCQTAAPDISPDRAEQLQSRVLAVTASVADGGLSAALEQLTTLEAELDAAAAEGSVSFARHQRIEAAIAALRDDIQAAIDALVKPEPAPVEPVAPVDDGVDEPAPAPEPDTETDEEKKAREAAEKAAEKAAEEAKKKADEEAKKAAEEAAKEAEEAAKKAEEERKKAEEEAQKSIDGSDDD